MAGMRALGRHRPGASPRPACEVARIQLPIYRQEDRHPPSGGGPSAPSPRKRRFPLSPAFPCSLPPSFSRRGWPPERGTAASGPARLPRGQSPRRPSLVDSLCQRISIISILKTLRRDRLFECLSISTASDSTHVCRTAPGLVLKTKKKRAADAALFLNRYIWRHSYASLKNFFLPT